MCNNSLTTNTAKPNIPESSLETAVDDVHVPATGHSHAWESAGGSIYTVGAAPNLMFPRSGVQIRMYVCTGDAIFSLWTSTWNNDLDFPLMSFLCVEAFAIWTGPALVSYYPG